MLEKDRRYMFQHMRKYLKDRCDNIGRKIGRKIGLKILGKIDFEKSLKSGKISPKSQGQFLFLFLNQSKRWFAGKIVELYDKI